MIEKALVIQFVQQRGRHAVPGAVLTPGIEVVEDRLPGSVPFREVTPWRPRMQDPENTVDEGAMLVLTWPTRLSVARRVREEGSDASPLGIGEFIAMHRLASCKKQDNSRRGSHCI